MDTEFYNAFATTPSSPSDVAKNLNMENETGTMQKPPKLMGIEDYHGWKKRFENWVQANHLKAWESIENEYVRPQNAMRVDKIISEFSEQERESYKRVELFACMPGETTKTLIERYIHLVCTMSQLKITKTPAEWVKKLTDALPQKEWSTYLMILKNSGQFSRLSIAQFIEKLEAQDLEQQKIARMNSSTHQQDIKLYYKGNVQTAEASPKIQTAFTAGNQSEPSS
ncbi:hypothetical protein Hdeb2414_s0004g00144451 [Helianthus debilis subsp. tardiflorus]